MTKGFFVVSAANGWTLSDGSVHPTGFWAEELTEPHRVFREAGFDIAIATPGGVAPTVDKLSLGDKEVEGYLDSIAGELSKPLVLAEVEEAEYDLVFYPGGHGPMEDLATDTNSGALLLKRLDEGRPVALLCHAPAAALAAERPDGTNAFTGKQMTGFSNIEEKVNPFALKAQWLLEDRLKLLGVDYSKAALPFRPNVVVDGNLFTGQNPQSATQLAEQLVEALQK
ncbi:type 1 glutamine amidotransferase domain-containing protein [Corynebacterium epidermidicanis]|uniref:Putative intracellular protease/amidase n=1 Tax=Corynebacterium epidermidicanis TaxID=1050174 RepID=A0A0G3GR10_9CORY|nr:type 1 glutamine amidotransferase domain-containing protein [Corynebacterium epidermidicanis]AKK03015.1 putative intracellular protease/amidase [Corynebacterium epidermidicanis]